MKYKVTNKKDRVVNLGKFQGKMVAFQPGEVKYVDGELIASMGKYFVNYVEGDFLDVQKVEDVETVVEEKPAPKKKTTKKKTTRKKTN